MPVGPATKRLFACAATPEERAAGFVETTVRDPHPPTTGPTKILAVVRFIDDKMMAVKLVSPRGAIRYAIMDRETVRPVRDTVATLDEMASRYPVQN